MYSKKESAILKKTFWTSFGQYMKPLVNAEGEETNWLNYKTGIRHIYFRMDADNEKASIAIELTHPDENTRQQQFQKLQQLNQIFSETIGDEWRWQWQWQKNVFDEHGKPVSRVCEELKGVNIFNKE